MYCPFASIGHAYYYYCYYYYYYYYSVMALTTHHHIVKVTVKTVPLQPWTGPEGSRRLRLSDFKTIGT